MRIESWPQPQVPKQEAPQEPPKQEQKGPKEGLGAEKNIAVSKALQAGNYEALLTMISQEQDKQLACEVIVKSMLDFHHKNRFDDVNDLLKTALANIDTHGDAVKELVLYTWKNNLNGERFWKNPNRDEVLFVDDDGELITFRGEIGTLEGGASKGMNFIKSLRDYEVLTGPNKGKIFNGSMAAAERNAPNSRPIEGPKM